MSFIIAVDGPAGSGKGTITKAVAEKIGFIRLDTGALYRCVTLEVIRNKEQFKSIFEIDSTVNGSKFDNATSNNDKSDASECGNIKFGDSKLNNVKSNASESDLNIVQREFCKSDILNIVEIARNMEVKFIANENINELDYVFLNGEDVTKAIRSNEVNNLISRISTIKELREEMLKIQRNLAKNQNTIMEGRDIGTVVFPNADLKIYLNADIEERARRRYKENMEKGIITTYEEVLEILKNRDKIDMGRAVAPLKKAEDAIEIDSTNMSIEEVVNKIEQLYRKRI